MCLAWSGPAFSQGQRLRRQGCRRVCPRHAPAWSGGCGLCGRSPGAPGRSCPHGRAARCGTRASAAGLWESSSDSRPSAGIASTARARLGRRASARLSPNPPTLQAMGMEVSVIAACDQKASARKFIRTNHEVRHLFHSLAAMGGVQPARDGRPNGHVNQPACVCDICQKPHDLQEEPPADWITGGLPCQSFSAMRQKNGHGTARRAASARTGSVEGHPDFGTVMDGFEAYLACRAPGGFCIEEVPSFNSAMPHGGGMTYLA
eukprot:4052668-Lingulodinium_polyedra.AAC.1